MKKQVRIHVVSGLFAYILFFAGKGCFEYFANQLYSDKMIAVVCLCNRFRNSFEVRVFFGPFVFCLRVISFRNKGGF